MKITHSSLTPVGVSPHGEHNLKAYRTHQGIPGIAKLSSGRIFATWYAGGTTECRENYIVLAYSDDDGLSWQEADAVIDPPHPDVRAFDPTLWLSPQGKLYWFWAQGCGCDSGISGIIDEVFDGLEGVWFTIIGYPEQEESRFTFSVPCRISNGIMLNKPTVLANGEWALPASLWSVSRKYADYHKEFAPVFGAMMIVSKDEGKTFSHRGTVDVTTLPDEPTFDEHQFLELKDGTIACFVRCMAGIGRSLSYDKGVSWTPLTIVEHFSQDTRFCIMRLKSGRILLIANNGGKVREKLTAFLSEDEGEHWQYRFLLDERKGVSYPDCVEDDEGHLYISYDYNRTQGGFLYLSKITEKDIINGKLGRGSFLGREIDHSAPVETKIV